MSIEKTVPVLPHIAQTEFGVGDAAVVIAEKAVNLLTVNCFVQHGLFKYFSPLQYRHLSCFTCPER
jgi:hypothetical protein